MEDELIRVLRLDSVLGEGLGREVPQVKGNYNVSATADRGREDMTIVRVWQFQTRN
jgi:hypothetical protein